MTDRPDRRGMEKACESHFPINPTQLFKRALGTWCRCLPNSLDCLFPYGCLVNKHQIELFLIEQSSLYWVLERNCILFISILWGFLGFATNLFKSPYCIKHFLGSFQYFSWEVHGVLGRLTHENQRSRPDRGSVKLNGPAVCKVITSWLVNITSSHSPN